LGLDPKVYDQKMKIFHLGTFSFFVSITSVLGDWIDIDTPKDKRTTTSFIDGTEYELIMSDEFNVPHRTFADGDDPMWTALDKSDDDSSAAGGGSLHFYNSTTVSTSDGHLKIHSYINNTEWNHYDTVKKEYKHVKKDFKSGMIQSWNKFCFTGGIVELDLILPGEPDIGGLWPAAWMLGNLGRATYEASTNMIWPWSLNKCDRVLQPQQSISPCNVQNHFGLNTYQGRGATEIDIIELMAGYSEENLPATDPPINFPYLDMTLQIAPGVPKDRPQSGSQPLWHPQTSKQGHPTGAIAQIWYEGLEFYGNTSLNPFFYGTYLAETKPEEPVQRTKKQASQADAIGAMHQITPSHFKKMHSFRIEWQPGPGGRIDWFTKAYRTNPDSMEESIVGDGEGQDWVKVYSLKDKSLSDLMGSQIPNEPTYFIFNTAISSTWGFPSSLPDGCKKCYDCNDPECECSFNQGFCEMMKDGGVNYEIDFVRVYQSKNHSAHVGNPHTIGCDPAEYPTREFIKGNEYRYCRSLPFSFNDDGPLKDIKNGGGKCMTDDDCGANIVHSTETSESVERRLETATGGRGQCISAKDYNGVLSKRTLQGQSVCKCNEGFTGPHCLAIDFVDEYPGVYAEKQKQSLFRVISKPHIPSLFMIVIIGLVVMLLTVMIRQARERRRPEHAYGIETPSVSNRKMKRPAFVTENSNLVITGRSV